MLCSVSGKFYLSTWDILSLNVGNKLSNCDAKHPNNCQFYICNSVHRNSRLKKSNKMQQYADIYLLLNYSTCFGRPSHPSSGVHKTAVAASGTDHTIWGASFLKRDQIRTGLLASSNVTKSVLIWSRLKKLVPKDSTICTKDCNYSFMYS